MNEIFVKSGDTIDLGKRGENLARCAVFDVSAWQKTYGEGAVHLLHQRNGDREPYPCVIEVKGGKVYWPLTETDVAVAGSGRAELQYFVGETRVKSETWGTRTDRGLNNAGATPEPPGENWLNTMLELGTETQENAQAAQMSAQSAQESAQEAKTSEENAKNSESLTLSYLEDAKTQAGFADAAADEATAAMRAAEASESNAAASAQAAAESETRAEGAAVRAETARNSIVLDEEKMAQAAEAAQKSADSAAASEKNAATSEKSAATSAASAAADAASASSAASTAISEADRAKAEADRAAGVAGGNFATSVEVQQAAAKAESNANAYTDRKIAAIPTPDVSGQINTHNSNTSAHQDIRTAASAAQKSANNAQTAANNAKTAADNAQTAADNAQQAAENAQSTAAGKVSKAGDTMTGALQLQPDGSEGYGKLYKNASAAGDYGTQLQDVDPDGNFMGLTISGKLQKLEFKKKRAGETEYRYTKLYDEDSPPNAWEVGALPAEGGELTGSVAIKEAYGQVNLEASEGHSSTLMKNADSSNDCGTVLRDTNGGNAVELKLNASEGSLKFAKGGNEYLVYTEETPLGANGIKVTLTAAGWSDNGDGRYKQTVPVAGVTTDASQIIVVDVYQDGTDLDADATVMEAWLDASGPAGQNKTQGNGTLTFYCTDVPSVNIPVFVGVH